jgi:uncharacterized protein with PQ loop repeat
VSEVILWAGWIGTGLLVWHFIPQVWDCIKQGHAANLSSVMLWSWFGGEVFLLPLIFSTGSPPLIANYVIGTVEVIILLKLKYYPRSQ